MKHIDILYLALYLILVSAITGFVFSYLVNEFGYIDKNLWLIMSIITLIIFSCTFFFDEVSYPSGQVHPLIDFPSMGQEFLNPIDGMHG